METLAYRKASGIPAGVKSRLPVILGALALSLIWVAPASAQFVLPEVRSAHVGVYTKEQAEAGAEVYAEVCSNCHNPANPLSGDKFLSLWSGKPLWRLYEFISTRMPYGNGGMLPPEQYNAVVAYVLQENGYPAGDTPLPQSPLEIAHINLDPHPEESDAP
tara:strand:+ start:307 stop:789 length:483 start_codon:yes stop_codon:yes gene_type:complete